MPWRLPPTVRSLIASSYCRYSSTATPNRASEPLRLLFCGSDNFSIASLRALTEAKREVPDLIQSIDVVHRPAKRTGRGLKTSTEVPIKHVATEELKLDTHVIDTFTGWTPPVPVDLIVAVSFGLFVPPRILGLAKYGGLNVHPSLLPDLRGPAPIKHAILRRREYTGVSIQTLDPKHYDHGTILAQTPAPGIPIPRAMTSWVLEQELAKTGAGMLVEVLKAHKFVPPHKDVGWYSSSNNPVDHAPKIRKQDHCINFNTHTLDHIISVQHALGNPWCILPNGDRLILHNVVDTGRTDPFRLEPGIYVPQRQQGPGPLIRAACGKIGILLESTYAGSRAGEGNARLLRLFPAQAPSSD